MKNNIITFSFASLVLASQTAHSALTNGAQLFIDAGSEFGLEMSPGNFLYTNIIGVDGIHLGTSQPPGTSHPGPITGDENPSIDIWYYYGQTGMDYTMSPTNVLQASGNTAQVDFSGWTITWNGIEAINMGSGSWGSNPEGVAQVTCAFDCNTGDTYSLYYTATVPVDDPSNFGGVRYELNLQGRISAVPVPAAAWLFGSGLIGLLGFTSNKKRKNKKDIF